LSHAAPLRGDGADLDDDARRDAAVGILGAGHADEVAHVDVGQGQGALAKLLRLGANTISRWEAGRNVQTAAMDMFLRLIRDLPGSIQYLRKHAA